MKRPGNPMPALDRATEAALRASIEKHGQILPGIRDQHGNILDGHHRDRIARELGLPPLFHEVEVRDEEHARELALNLDRRHLDPEQRRQIVAELRTEGHSVRAIAGALGVSKSVVHKDTARVSTGGHLAEKTTGQDGKSYPARRRKNRRKKQMVERPMYVRFVEAIGVLGDLLEKPDKLVGAIPDSEREQWASQLRAVAGLAAVAADFITTVPPKSDRLPAPQAARQKALARNAKERVETFVGTCNSFERVLDYLPLDRALSVSSPQEAQHWDAAFAAAGHGLDRLRRRLQELT